MDSDLLRERRFLAVVGAVINDLAILDGLDNSVGLDSIAVLIEGQIAGDQAGHVQGHQSVTDRHAVGGAGGLDGVNGSHVSVIAAGGHAGDGLSSAAVVLDAGVVLGNPGLEALDESLTGFVGGIVSIKESGEEDVGSLVTGTLGDGDIIPGIAGHDGAGDAGVTVGSLYALIAIGYTMVYGILRLINFAHGDIFMMAGFFMVYISASCSLAVSIPLVLILTVLLGVLIEKAAYKPLRTAPRMSVMISAIGVSYLLQNLATYITGGIARAYPDITFLTKVMQVGGLSIKRITIITPILTIVLVAILVVLIQKTKIGMAMRAVSRDFETSQLMGIKINSVISMTFVIGSFLAGVASILYFANYGQVSPMIGAMPGLKAFVAAVFGGIGSIPGAVIGAFIIGICESFIKANENIAVFSNAFTFALLIIILLCKPNGLFGEKLTEKV